MSVAILGKGKKVALKRRHARIRKRISGTPERPRLVVTRSNRHMVAQVVDDTKGITLVSASTLQADFAGFEGTKTEAAKKVGELIAEKAKAAGARKWWLGELSREANAKGVSLEELPITPADVAEVEKLIADGKLNDKLAKQTVAGVLAGEGTPDEVVKKHGFQVVSDDGALEKAVDEALAANPDIVEKLKSGNMKPMGVIIGAVMKATRGQADAKAVTKVVMGKIKG